MNFGLVAHLHGWVDAHVAKIRYALVLKLFKHHSLGSSSIVSLSKKCTVAFA